MRRAILLGLALLAACGDDDVTTPDAAGPPDATWLPDSAPLPDTVIIPDATIPVPDAYVAPPDAPLAASCSAPTTIVPGTPALAELGATSALAPLGTLPDCSYGDGPEGVYAYVLDHVADLTFSMSCTDCDPVVYIRRDCDGLDGTTEIPDAYCADLYGTGTAEEIAITNAAPGTYYLIADTYGSDDTGPFSATLVLREIVGAGATCNGVTSRCGPGLFCNASDVCQDVFAYCDGGAAGILDVGTPASGDNTASTDSLDCDLNGAGPEDYWIFTPTVAGTYNIRAVAGGAQTLFVYSSTDCTTAAGSANCSDIDAADVNFDIPLAAGEEVYIVVDGPAADGEGPYTLTADPVVVHAIGESCNPVDLRLVRCDAAAWCNPATSLCAAATVESEPNETPGTADTALANAPIRGGLGGASDVDVFTVELAAGQVLFAETRDGASDTCASYDLDSFLTVYGPDGTTVLVADDDSGPGYCSVAVIRAAAPGPHVVEVSHSPYASTYAFDYTLFLSVASPGEVAETVDDNSTSGVAQALTLPATLSGAASSGTDADWTSFSLPAGVRLVAATRDGATASCTIGLNSFVSIYASDGTTLLASDDNNYDDTCSTAVWPIDAAGTYYVSTIPGSTSTSPYDYRLLLFTILY